MPTHKQFVIALIESASVGLVWQETKNSFEHYIIAFVSDVDDSPGVVFRFDDNDSLVTMEGEC